MHVIEVLQVVWRIWNNTLPGFKAILVLPFYRNGLLRQCRNNTKPLQNSIYNHRAGETRGASLNPPALLVFMERRRMEKAKGISK